MKISITISGYQNTEKIIFKSFGVNGLDPKHPNLSKVFKMVLKLDKAPKCIVRHFTKIIFIFIFLNLQKNVKYLM